MDDTISRQAAIDAIKKAYFKGVAIDAVANLPSVEPKKGMWINAPSPSMWGEMANHCSACGSIAIRRSDDSEILTDFCPWCGADMRGEEA